MSTNRVNAQALFVTSDLTIDTLSENVVFVGKNNQNDFQTVQGATITLTVTTGANIPSVNFTVNGTQYSDLNIFGHHVANITGGNVVIVYGRDTSTTNITGGKVENEVYGYGASTVNVGGGDVNSVDGFENSTINISNGFVSHVRGVDANTINITGGIIRNRVLGTDSSIIDISGGGVNYIQGTGNSIFHISGGDFDLADLPNVTQGGNIFRIQEDSVVNIYGSNLSYSMIGSGSDLTGNYIGYMLSGLLANGQALDGVVFHDYTGGLSIGNPYLGSANLGNLRFFSTASTAPEPGSCDLLGLGSLLLVGIRFRRKVSVG
jgi:hypothetical protein